MESADVVQFRRGPVRAHARALVAAFTFLTRLPVGRLVAHDVYDLPLSVIYFPAVGLVVGGIGGAVYAGAAFVWPSILAVLLSIAATVLVTGAFHEDALADAFDGFGGGWNREQVLAIMKDSRVGSYALVGVALVLAIKVWSLVAITGQSRSTGAVLRALVAAHVLGRWSSVPLIWKHSYVRPSRDGERCSAGGPFVAGATGGRVVFASVLSLAIVVTVLGMRGIVATIVAALLTLLAGRYFSRRIGGITGDALGATNQLIELGVYLVLAASLS